MRSAGVIGRSPRHGRPPLGFVTAGGFVTLDGGFVTGFSAGGVMVRVPLMTPIGHGGGSSCSLSSRSQAAQCNIHQAFIIAPSVFSRCNVPNDSNLLCRRPDISDEQAESGRAETVGAVSSIARDIFEIFFARRGPFFPVLVFFSRAARY